MTEQMFKDQLVIVPSFGTKTNEDGTIVLSRKFISDMNAYVTRWPTQVTALVEEKNNQHFDSVTVNPSNLAFNIHVVNNINSRDTYSKLTSATLVMGDQNPRLLGFHRRLNKLCVPNVAVVQETFRTRYQTTNIKNINLFRKASQHAWNIDYERKFRRDIQAATAVQCNGIPAYEAYSSLNDNILLYFDSQAHKKQRVTDMEQKERFARIKRPHAKMRLAFVGDLNKENGAHLLPQLVRQLRYIFVPFELKIFGTGELEQSIKNAIKMQGPENDVKFMGAVNFANTLVPTLRTEVDLLVAPFMQGEPVSTYLEALSCGIPIVGFANEAWSGILGRVAVGWSARLGDVLELAARIKKINESRNDWAAKSWVADNFAAEHQYEKTIDKRVEHLLHTSHAVLVRR